MKINFLRGLLPFFAASQLRMSVKRRHDETTSPDDDDATQDASPRVQRLLRLQLAPLPGSFLRGWWNDSNRHIVVGQAHQPVSICVRSFVGTDLLLVGRWSEPVHPEHRFFSRWIPAQSFVEIKDVECWSPTIPALAGKMKFGQVCVHLLAKRRGAATSLPEWVRSYLGPNADYDYLGKTSLEFTTPENLSAWGIADKGNVLVQNGVNGRQGKQVKLMRTKIQKAKE